KGARDEFSSIAQNRHRLQHDPGAVILMIGSENWPFPTPIVGSGKAWHFDASAADQAMLPHRKEANEFNAIEACAGYVGAQRQFGEQHGMQQYASRVQDLGNLIPPDLARSAASEGEAYHGYFFRTLNSQGPNATGGATDYVVQGTMLAGFGLVAWPAQYGVSGVRT